MLNKKQPLQSTISPGQIVLVIEYVASFSGSEIFRGQHNDTQTWHNFHAKFVQVNKITGLSAIVDITESPELTAEQKRMTDTGKISVSCKMIDAALPEANIVESRMTKAGRKGGKARAAHHEYAAAKRSVIARQVIEYYEQGFSTAQAAKAMQRRPETVHKAMSDAGVIEPRRRGARLVRLDGAITYYDSALEAAKHAGCSYAMLSKKRVLCFPDGRIEVGDWIEWSGAVREYLPDAQRFPKQGVMA